MKNSKLECVDEHAHDTMAAEVHVQDDEYEEIDDFDPYFFIKNLPALSAVVPTYRPMLLPKQTRSCPPTTLVLDLDGNKSYNRYACLLHFMHVDWLLRRFFLNMLTFYFNIYHFLPCNMSGG